MRRALKILAWTLGSLVLLVVLAAGALYLFLTSDYLRAQIENRAGSMAGRKTTIARVEFDWGWTTRVRLDGVEISNADWDKAPHMLTAKLVDFDIRLWPLLGGHIVLPRLTLEAPELALERNDKGELNWSFEQSPAAATVAKQIAPEERSDAPIIGQLKIEDGHVVYHDSKRRLELDGTVTTAIGKAPGSDQAELKLKGRLEDKPLTLHFIGGSILALRDDKTPYPLKLDVVFGPTKLSLEGTVQDPFQFKGADVDFSLSGPDLADVFPLLGVPGPPTPPYRMLGKLHREQGIWRLDDMKWHVGESDLFGTVTLDQRPKRSLLKANLVSEHLNFADLAPLIGATPGKHGNVSAQQKQTELQLEASGDLFPNIPLHVERLRVMDMDVTLDARKVVSAPYLSVQALKARVKIDDGKAVVDPLKVTLAGGVAAGSMMLDARSDVPKAGGNLRFDGLDLAAFFKGSRYFETTQGKLQGHINLIGTGRSLAQVMGTANGEFSLAMTGGSISGLLVALAGTDIIEALLIYITGDNRIPISCATARATFQQGMVRLDRALLDTRRSVLHFDGTINLRSQAVKIAITADAKDFSLLNLHAPILYSGKIREPHFSIDRLIPIPTPDFGGAKDVDCSGRIGALLAE
jgi:AsmA family protein